MRRLGRELLLYLARLWEAAQLPLGEDQLVAVADFKDATAALDQLHVLDAARERALQLVRQTGGSLVVASAGAIFDAQIELVCHLPASSRSRRPVARRAPAHGPHAIYHRVMCELRAACTGAPPLGPFCHGSAIARRRTSGPQSEVRIWWRYGVHRGFGLAALALVSPVECLLGGGSLARLRVSHPDHARRGNQSLTGIWGRGPAAGRRHRPRPDDDRPSAHPATRRRRQEDPRVDGVPVGWRKRADHGRRRAIPAVGDLSG